MDSNTAQIVIKFYDDYLNIQIIKIYTLLKRKQYFIRSRYSIDIKTEGL